MVNEQDVFDLRLTAGFSERWSATASVPWLLGSWSLPLPFDPPGPRREQDASGIGDISLVPRFWLLDPAGNPGGNLQIGLGVKAPTGDENAKDDFPDFSGGNVRARPVDVSIQPGDGGWGGVLDLSGHLDAGPVRLFAGGSYLFNFREENRTLSTASVLLGEENVPEEIRRNSVPDQYLAQVGAATSLGGGVTASAALRWEGVPARDRFGGNDGFRRPGYTIAAAPGLSFSFDRYTVAASAPITLFRNRQEDARGAEGDATFADWALILSFAVRF